MTTLCQFCLDRQLPEPEEAIGLYQKRPIGELCLGIIMDNANATQVIDGVEQPSFNERKAKTLETFGKMQALADDWHLTEHEVLLSRDDFFNYQAPALVNLKVEQIKELISYRKAILFAYKIVDERWTSLIDSIRSEERRAEGLLKVTKSIKENSKPSKAGKDAKAKLAKAMGVSIEVLEATMASARQTEFGKVIEGQPNLSNWEKPKNEVRETLTELQNQIKAQTTVVSSSGVKRCEKCGKLTCICVKVKL